MRRNGCLGQLSMARQSIQYMLNSDLIDLHDRQVLIESLEGINLVLSRWDKHYCSKLFAKLNNEATNV